MEQINDLENENLNDPQTVNSDLGAVSGGYFLILDKNGIEIPDHYSGRRRTYKEAKKMLDNLNQNGEFRPYTMVEV